MARYTSGPEWGRFVRETDPVRSFTDSFLNMFKEGMAIRLAQEEQKRAEQRKRREQKALDDYRDLQLMLKRAELEQRERLARERMKSQENIARMQVEGREQLARMEPPPKKTVVEYRGLPKGGGRGSRPTKVESLNKKIEGLLFKIQDSQYYPAFAALNGVENLDELNVVYREYVRHLPEKDGFGGTKANFDVLYRYMKEFFGREPQNVPRVEKETEQPATPQDRLGLFE